MFVNNFQHHSIHNTSALLFHIVYNPKTFDWMLQFWKMLDVFWMFFSQIASFRKTALLVRFSHYFSNSNFGRTVWRNEPINLCFMIQSGEFFQISSWHFWGLILSQFDTSRKKDILIFRKRSALLELHACPHTLIKEKYQMKTVYRPDPKEQKGFY